MKTTCLNEHQIILFSFYWSCILHSVGFLRLYLNWCQKIFIQMIVKEENNSQG